MRTPTTRRTALSPKPMLDFLQGAWPIPDDIREKLTLALAEEYTFEPQGRSRLSKCDAPQEGRQGRRSHGTVVFMCIRKAVVAGRVLTTIADYLLVAGQLVWAFPW